MSTAKHEIDLWGVRHPESVSNVDDIHYGNNASLTERGLRQAYSIVERFERLGVQIIICSTAKRTFGPIDALAKERGIQCLGSDLFLEWHRPTATIGKPNQDQAVMEALNSRLYGLGNPGYVPQEGEEPWENLVSRIDASLAFIQDINRKLDKTRIGMVTHGLYMRFILARVLLGWCDYDTMPHLFRCMYARTGLANAAFMHFWFGNEFRSNSRSWNVELGDVSYMEQ